MRAERWEIHSVSLPRNGVYFLSSSANPWQKKTPKQTNKIPKPKIGKSHCHQFLSPLPFVAPSDEHMAPWQTVGEALLPQILPKSMRRGIKGICLCLLVTWQYTFSYFSLSGRLFLFFLLQFCHQPNKRRTDEKYHMFFLGFISLS